MEANSLIDLLVYFLAACDVMRRKPAPHPLGLQIGVQPISELLIFAGVADEAGVELDRLTDE
jgi:hypothetical protein